MTERLLILTIVVLVSALGACALRGYAAWRLRRLRGEAPERDASPLADIVASGPALLYFTTDTCAQCRFQQTPILQQLQAQAAGVPVITLDAVARHELARHFGIMTVPSTVLLDAQRLPAAINHGLAPLPKLKAQLAAVQAGARAAGLRG